MKLRLKSHLSRTPILSESGPCFAERGGTYPDAARILILISTEGEKDASHRSGICWRCVGVADARDGPRALYVRHAEQPIRAAAHHDAAPRFRGARGLRRAVPAVAGDEGVAAGEDALLGLGCRGPGTGLRRL